MPGTDGAYGATGAEAGGAVPKGGPEDERTVLARCSAPYAGPTPCPVLFSRGVVLVLRHVWYCPSMLYCTLHPSYATYSSVQSYCTTPYTIPTPCPVLTSAVLVPEVIESDKRAREERDALQVLALAFYLSSYALCTRCSVLRR
eukprot:460870-Rhodomonas_salina.4